MAHFRSATVLALIFVLLASTSPAVRADTITPLLPAETELFLYFDIQQLLRSELFKKYLEKPIKNDKGWQELMKNGGIGDFIKKTGLNPLTDVEKIVLSSSPIIYDNSPLGGPVPHFCILVSGKFDSEKLTAAATELVAAHKEHVLAENTGKVKVAKLLMAIVSEKDHKFLQITLLLNEEKIETYATVIDGRFLIFGLKEDVRGALGRVRQKTRSVIRNKEVADGLARMDPATIGSLRGDNSILKDLPGIDDPNTAKLIQKIAAVRVDLRVASDIKLVLTLDMIDADAAKELKPLIVNLGDLLKGVVALLTVQEPKAKPLDEVGKNLTIRVKGKTVTVQTSLSGQAIDTLVKNATK